MTKVEKSIRQFLNRPASMSYIEIEKVLFYCGFEKVHAKGSHQKFKHPLLPYDLIIPVHNNDCKDFYKKLASKIIKREKLYH